MLLVEPRGSPSEGVIGVFVRSPSEVEGRRDNGVTGVVVEGDKSVKIADRLPSVDVNNWVRPALRFIMLGVVGRGKVPLRVGPARFSVLERD